MFALVSGGCLCVDGCCQDGQVAAAPVLIQAGADVNPDHVDRRHGSPLAAAAKHGSLACARLLVAHGANVNAPLRAGPHETVLAAAIFGQGWPSPSVAVNMVRFLINEAGADPTQLSRSRPFPAERMEAWKLDQDSYYRREMARPLIRERLVERQVLIDIGFCLRGVVITCRTRWRTDQQKAA